MAPRLFTPQRARRTAERLRPTLERIRALFGALERRRPARCGPDQLVEGPYFALLVALHRQLEAVRRSGATVVDVRGGAVRFPARRGGRPVLLCWRPDEDGLAWWDPARRAAGVRAVDDDDVWSD